MKPRNNVEEMDEYIPPLEGRRGLLRLDFNENTVGPSPKVLESLRNLTDEDVASYPEYSVFKEKLADYIGVNENNLLVTNATDEAINVVMQTYVDKKEEVILPVPTFAMFKFYAQVAGAKISEVLYADSLAFPTQKVLNKINKKTKLIILCNPNNPTGTIIKREDIIKILEKAKNCIVMIDEAYNQFSKETAKDMINTYENLIVIQTFSKAFGMGGLRLGYIISNEENIRNIGRVLSPYSVNTAAIKAGIAALDDTKYVEWYAKQIEEGKKYVLNEFKKLKIKTFPTTANFFLAKFKNPLEIVDKLKEKGILVRDRSSYPLLKGCVRITIGTKSQMEFLVKALKDIK